VESDVSVSVLCKFQPETMVSSQDIECEIKGTSIGHERKASPQNSLLQFKKKY
jgi:hypothetical protein